jgi:hypothetical protein
MFIITFIIESFCAVDEITLYIVYICTYCMIHTYINICIERERVEKMQLKFVLMMMSSAYVQVDRSRG